ncbi:MAG: hypothetical protein FIA92_11350 [Chloroflexi bacterium]|nr:hypothetical protein [Chloroflexota bacterium]
MPVVPLVVSVPGIPPSPNQTRREHWAKRAKEARLWRESAFYAARQAMATAHGGWSFPLRSASVRITLVSTTAVRRDPDNAIAACKPVLDGIVQAGLLADDSFAVIRDLAVGVARGREEWTQIEVSA